MRKFGKCHACRKNFWYDPETVAAVVTPYPGNKKRHDPVCPVCVDLIQLERVGAELPLLDEWIGKGDVS